MRLADSVASLREKMSPLCVDSRRNRNSSLRMVSPLKRRSFTEYFSPSSTLTVMKMSFFSGESDTCTEAMLNLR